MKPTSDSRPAESTKKAFYHRPQLQVYGDLREITNSVTRVGTTSDPGHPTLRSH